MRLTVIMFALGLLCLATHGMAADWRVEDLGVPITAVTYGNSHAVLAAGPKGEGRMFYTSYYCSTGAELVGYDFRSGRSLRKKLASEGGYAIALGKDNSIYVGGVYPGDLYRYQPLKDEFTRIDLRALGVSYIWEAATSNDGTIYCAAGYPQARLVAYEPDSGKVRDLGIVAPGEEYMRSICIDKFGKVWCGVGIHAHLVVYDPATGSKTEVLPKEYAGNSFVYSLKSVGDYVLASVFYDGTLLAYDAASQKVIRKIPKPAGQQSWLVRGGEDDRTAYLFSVPGEDIYRCELPDLKLTKVAERVGRLQIVEGGRWLHCMDDQSYVAYDLEAGKTVARHQPTRGGDGMDIFALTSGPDGNIYGSTYINMHMFRYDAGSGKTTDLGEVSRWPGQVDSLSLGRDGLIYIGSYIDAVVSLYDPARPIRPGTQPADNPREIGPVGKGQYRTRDNCLGPDGRIYVGSIPSYNTAPTGAFTICDPKSGRMDVRIDFVPGGTVHRLVSDDRFVYGSGGGEFFVYDPASDKKHFRAQRLATAMALLPEGKVLASGGGKIFVYDREANSIVAEQPNPAGDFTHMAAGRDGQAYGVNAGKVARVSPQGAVEVLTSPGGKFAALDGEGRLYFARGPRLLRCSRR